uniref:Uncharacterized protein n=1 Tax=Ciona savignyi TaxID=51511 RepID=H2ZAJ5_CIOSA
MPETLMDMEYMQGILKESVRCSGMFSFAGRVEDIDITVQNHLIPKGTPILEAIMTEMRSEAFSCPDVFNPKNFTKDNNHLNPLTFIPFAFGGSRHKPEESLVYLLAAVTVSSLFRNLQVSLAGKEIEPFAANFESFVAMPSTEEIWVTVSKEKEVENVG